MSRWHRETTRASHPLPWVRLALGAALAAIGACTDASAPPGPGPSREPSDEETSTFPAEPGDLLIFYHRAIFVDSVVIAGRVRYYLDFSWNVLNPRTGEDVALTPVISRAR